MASADSRLWKLQYFGKLCFPRWSFLSWFSVLLLLLLLCFCFCLLLLLLSFPFAFAFDFAFWLCLSVPLSSHLRFPLPFPLPLPRPLTFCIFAIGSCFYKFCLLCKVRFSENVFRSVRYDLSANHVLSVRVVLSEGCVITV